MPEAVLAIDQGTTGSTALVLDRHGKVLGRATEEFTQHYPQPGWVEHEPDEIWRVSLDVMGAALHDTSVASLLHPKRAGTEARAFYEPYIRSQVLAVSFQTQAELWAWAEDGRWGPAMRAGLERFLTQPFFVSEPYTGLPGRYVPLEETLRGFEEILEGRHDRIAEQHFYMAGTIGEVVKKARLSDDPAEGTV